MMLRLVFLLCCFLANVTSQESAIDDPDSPYYINRTGRNDEEVLLAKWTKLESSLKSTANDLIKQALPTLIRAVSESEVSDECQGALLNVLSGIRKLDKWAVDMLDATGKLSSGILEGSTTDFGIFDECVNIIVPSVDHPDKPKFTGQFCTLEFKPPLIREHAYFGNLHYKHPTLTNQTDTVISEILNIASFYFALNFRIGICVPSSCSIDDLHKLISPMAARLYLSSNIARCEIKEATVLTIPQIIVLASVAVLVFIVLTATIFDFGTANISIDSKLKITTEEITNDAQNGKMATFFLCFSLKKTVPLSVGVPLSENPLFMNGIRVLSFVWLVMGSVYNYTNPQIINQSKSSEIMTRRFAMQAIFGSSLAFDAIVFCTAYLLGHTVGRSLVRGPFFYLSLFIDRCLRHTAALLSATALTLLIPLTNWGPMWSEMTGPPYRNCVNNWWTNILFISNFVNGQSNRCLRNSWFISCNMQFFVLGLFLTAILSSKKRLIGIWLAFVLAVAGIISVTVITVVHSYPPAFLFSQFDILERIEFEDNLLQKPYPYLSAMSIGLILGHQLSQRISKSKTNKYLLLVGWCMTFIASTSAVFGIYDWNNQFNENRITSAIFATIHRPLWIAALAFITFVCQTGQAETLNKFLSYSFFIPTSRMFTVALLTFPLYQNYIAAQCSVTLYITFLFAVLFFSGNLLLSLVTSLIVGLMSNQPWTLFKMNFLLSRPTESIKLTKHVVFDRSMSAQTEISNTSD